MAFSIGDVFGAIEKWGEWKQTKQWISLGIQLVCSFVLSGCFASGTALIAHREPWEALGHGLVAGVTFAVVVWRRSQLTRGMLLALPADEAKSELDANQQIISK